MEYRIHFCVNEEPKTLWAKLCLWWGVGDGWQTTIDVDMYEPELQAAIMTFVDSLRTNPTIGEQKK